MKGSLKLGGDVKSPNVTKEPIERKKVTEGLEKAAFTFG